MSRNDAYDLIRVGRHIERADMTTRIVDVGLVNLLPHLSGGTDELGPYDNILWMSILRSLSGYQMYRQHVRDRVEASAVVKFTLQNPDFPRAAAYCLKELHQCLAELPNHDKVLTTIKALESKLQSADMDVLLENGLHEYIDELQLEIGHLHSDIAQAWFLPNIMSQSQSAS